VRRNKKRRTNAESIQTGSKSSFGPSREPSAADAGQKPPMPSGSTLQVRKELLRAQTVGRFTAHFHMLNNIRLNERVLYETSQAFCFQTPTDGITRIPHRQLSLGEEETPKELSTRRLRSHRTFSGSFSSWCGTPCAFTYMDEHAGTESNLPNTNSAPTPELQAKTRLITR